MSFTKHNLAAAGLRPGELARIIDVAPNTVSRYYPDAAQHIDPPAAVDALVYVLGQLPDDIRATVRADLLAKEHRGVS